MFNSKSLSISSLKQHPIVLGVTLLVAGLITGSLLSRYFAGPVAASNNRLSSQNSLPEPNQDEPVDVREADEKELGTDIVRLPQEQWAASQLVIAPVTRDQLKQTIKLTGQVSLNEDRIAHLYPMVSGSVDAVYVTLGQVVKKDELLVLIHSREIGQAKLELYQAKLQLEMATVKDRLQQEIARNAKELLETLRANKDIQQIEQQFRNRAMGDFRERLLAAYANYLKSDADVKRLESVTQSGAISGNQLLTAQANRNADFATFQARIEQIDYEIETSILLSSQAVKESQTRVEVASTSLKILGSEETDVSTSQPDRSISHYPIRAPFEGTVISKDVVLKEQVRPDVMVLGIADLSTVWISADIYEKHVPLLNRLNDQAIVVRNEAFPDKSFSAQVFYTGRLWTKQREQSLYEHCRQQRASA